MPKPYRPTSKKTCDQTKKEYYIVHYRNLKFYVRMGMIIGKVHRIVSVDQIPWLEKYIDYNTKKRAQKLTQILRKITIKIKFVVSLEKQWKMLEI